MDALEALRDDRTDSEQHRTLGGPISGAASAILTAGDDDQRHAVRLVAHRRVKYPHDVTSRVVRGPIAFVVWSEEIP